MSAPIHRLIACALLVMVAMTPLTVLAFDCDPIASLICDDPLVYGNLNTDSVPGEYSCGFDYTGWAFHVYDFTLVETRFQHVTATGEDASPFSHLLLFDGCPGGVCIASDTSMDGGGLVVEGCLDPGTYTVVVASNTASTPSYAVGLLGCFPCDDPVPAGVETFGSVKSLYR